MHGHLASPGEALPTKGCGDGGGDLAGVGVLDVAHDDYAALAVGPDHIAPWFEPLWLSFQFLSLLVPFTTMPRP